ncbi:MAG TPA: bacteriohopanetetrol glucosamine biosynthesis glycosyltransferase HpnI [Terriglobia bacterium]|jgi:ceramide glucosyltransferase|nr:bacteriohopanetetrol glucosamine biosynthesis glycosyltransferase HpnI [Terriglobia bacterium]
MLEYFVLAIAVVGLLASTIYLGMTIVAASRFRASAERESRQAEARASLPPVTVLKPLHGMEPLLEECLEGFFRQDYPIYELLFSARTAADPALDIVESLKKKYPRISARIVLSGEPKYASAKVYAMEKMLPLASHSILVISDSDVRVTPGYLRHVVYPMLNENVGMVTCLYRGVPTGGIWSLLEALGMSIEMSSGVLVADLLEGMRFALGPTMVIRRNVLESWGGFRALAEHLDDDFAMGAMTYASGKKVVLSHHVIEHVALSRTGRQSVLHQLRWMMSSRFSRPKGHIGTGLTFAMPFGLIGLVAGWMAGNWPLGLALLGLAYANRVVQALVVGWGVTRDKRSALYCWLYPLRDLEGFFLWCGSFFGSEIVWRGERFRVVSGGRIVRKSIQPASGS